MTALGSFQIGSFKRFKYIRIRQEDYATNTILVHSSRNSPLHPCFRRLTETGHKQSTSLLSSNLHPRHGWRFFIEYALRPEAVFEIWERDKRNWRTDLTVVQKPSATQTIDRIRRLTVRVCNSSDVYKIDNGELGANVYPIPIDESRLKALNRRLNGLPGEPGLETTPKWAERRTPERIMLDGTTKTKRASLPESILSSRLYCGKEHSLKPRYSQPFDILFTVDGHSNAYLVDDTPHPIPFGRNYIFVLHMVAENTRPLSGHFFVSLKAWNEISIEPDTTLNALKRSLRSLVSRRFKTSQPTQDH